MTTPEEDSEHLRLLALFDYIVAAIMAVFSLLPVIHLTIGLAMVTGHLDAQSPNGPPLWMGWFFVAFASVFIVSGLAFSACLAFSAKFLKQRRRYLYCLVVAGIACLFTPFGTVLGVFTIIVLTRPSVRQTFDAPSVFPEV